MFVFISEVILFENNGVDTTLCQNFIFSRIFIKVFRFSLDLVLTSVALVVAVVIKSLLTDNVLPVVDNSSGQFSNFPSELTDAEIGVLDIEVELIGQLPQLFSGLNSGTASCEERPYFRILFYKDCIC